MQIMGNHGNDKHGKAAKEVSVKHLKPLETNFIASDSQKLLPSTCQMVTENSPLVSRPAWMEL